MSTKLADVERLADDVDREFGRIDILVNNAGINIRGPIQHTELSRTGTRWLTPI